MKNWASAYRKAHNISQTELARRLGVSRSLICKFESGDRKPGIELLPVIKEKCGLDTAMVRPDLAKLGS